MLIGLPSPTWQVPSARLERLPPSIPRVSRSRRPRAVPAARLAACARGALDPRRPRRDLLRRLRQRRLRPLPRPPRHRGPVLLPPLGLPALPPVRGGTGQGAPRRSFATYAKRRFVRIVPAYWLVLTVAAIVPGFAGAFSGNWWAYYGLLQNYPVYTPEGACATDPYRCGIPVAWSLSIEVAFYILLPLFVLAMAWVGSRLPRARAGSAGAHGRSGALTVVSVVDPQLRPRYRPAHLALLLAARARLVVRRSGSPSRRSRSGRRRREPEPRFVGVLRRPADSRPLLAAPRPLRLQLLRHGRTRCSPSRSTTQLEFVIQYLLVGVIAALVLLPAIFGLDGGGLAASRACSRTGSRGSGSSPTGSSSGSSR